MKKFLLKFLILFCLVVIVPSIRSIRSENFDGHVFEEKIPVDIENRSLYYAHDSVKWGGPGNLACASNLNVRYRDRYHKNNLVRFSDTKTSY